MVRDGWWWQMLVPRAGGRGLGKWLCPGHSGANAMPTASQAPALAKPGQECDEHKPWLHCIGEA